MVFPFHDLTMLALESGSVINLRLAKIGRGGFGAVEEIALMFAEKADAVVEATTAALAGQPPSGMINRLRVHVAANEARLSA